MTLRCWPYVILKVCSLYWGVKIVEAIWSLSGCVTFICVVTAVVTSQREMSTLKSYGENRFSLSSQILVFPDLSAAFPSPVYGWKVWCSRTHHLGNSQFIPKLIPRWASVPVGTLARLQGRGGRWGQNRVASALLVSRQQFGSFPGSQDQLGWIPRSAPPYTPALSRCTGSWEALVCKIQPSSRLAIRINLQADRFWLLL